MSFPLPEVEAVIRAAEKFLGHLRLTRRKFVDDYVVWYHDMLLKEYKSRTHERLPEKQKRLDIYGAMVKVGENPRRDLTIPKETIETFESIYEEYSSLRSTATEGYARKRSNPVQALRAKTYLSAYDLERSAAEFAILFDPERTNIPNHRDHMDDLVHYLRLQYLLGRNEEAMQTLVKMEKIGENLTLEKDKELQQEAVAKPRYYPAKQQLYFAGVDLHLHPADGKLGGLDQPGSAAQLANYYWDRCLREGPEYRPQKWHPFLILMALTDDNWMRFLTYEQAASWLGGLYSDMGTWKGAKAFRRIRVYVASRDKRFLLSSYGLGGAAVAFILAMLLGGASFPVTDTLDAVLRTSGEVVVHLDDKQVASFELQHPDSLPSAMDALGAAETVKSAVREDIEQSGNLLEAEEGTDADSKHLFLAFSSLEHSEKDI